jgi:hypothetical protein
MTTHDANIQKCIDDIKDITLVLTNPKEWEKQKEEKYDRNQSNRKSEAVIR